MRITGTFLDEVSYDIPSQNWGEKEWDRDFDAMKAVGIDTVVLIRCGYRKWMTYPSGVLTRECGCFVPPIDLVAMYLRLAQRHGISFYFGTYDSGQYWHSGDYRRELDISRKVVDEVWEKYGRSPAFKGWYLSLEVSRKIGAITDTYASLGKHCKDISGGLPVLISPYIDGNKNLSSEGSSIDRGASIEISEHEKEWDDIFAGIRGAVDIVAFQDGHVDFDALPDFLAVNKTLAERNGMSCWTNSETFDRDMPIKFLPIKWEKLLLKLSLAQRAGIAKGITFEFSHFMSPFSCYPQAKGLYDRYCEHFGIAVGASA
jgi:hypothetical protein